VDGKRRICDARQQVGTRRPPLAHVIVQPQMHRSKLGQKPQGYPSSTQCTGEGKRSVQSRASTSLLSQVPETQSAGPQIFQGASKSSKRRIFQGVRRDHLRSSYSTFNLHCTQVLRLAHWSLVTCGNEAAQPEVNPELREVLDEYQDVLLQGDELSPGLPRSGLACRRRSRCSRAPNRWRGQRTG